MKFSIFLKIIFTISLIFNNLVRSHAQTTLAQNPTVLNLLKQGTQKMYNYEFDDAEVSFNQATTLLPQHPAPFLLKAMLIYWRNLPLIATHAKIPEMKNLLSKAEELARVMQVNGQVKSQTNGQKSAQEQEKLYAEGVFFEMTAKSIVMQHYAKVGESSKALGLAKDIYGHLKTGMRLKDSYHEFYFSSGLYNYYREAYPEAKPFFKIVSWIFQSGDKKLGLEQLVFAGKNCVISQTQAWFFLTHIYLTYEKNPFKSVEYARELVLRFPKNRYYLCRYVETLLLTKQFELAATHIQILLKNPSPEVYTVMITQVLAGMLEEKHHKNYVLAKNYYQNALQLAAPFQVAGNHYQAYCYLGLSKIATAEKQPATAKINFKKAEDIAEYKYIFDF